MSSTTLVLCDRCGTPIDAPTVQVVAVQIAERILGAPIVAHCVPCAEELNEP